MKRILITGGLGFIGANLVDRLISTTGITVFDDLSAGRVANVREHIGNPNLELLEGNVLDAGKIDRAISKASAVVHLAAIVSVKRSLEDPRLAHQTNVEGTLNVLEGCLRHSVERMVFASSAAVYGDNHKEFLVEDMTTNPSNLYGATKVAGEAYVRAYNEAHGLETSILRLMNVYGPGKSPGPYAGVITQFADAVCRGAPLAIYGDGEQTRDFVYVSDVIDAIVSALQSPCAIGSTLNIGTGRASSINELAAIFSTITKSHTPIQHLPPRQGEIRRSCADIEKARKILSYEPRVSLEDGIDSYMKWFRANNENFPKESNEIETLPSPGT